MTGTLQGWLEMDISIRKYGSKVKGSKSWIPVIGFSTAYSSRRFHLCDRAFVSEMMMMRHLNKALNVLALIQHRCHPMTCAPR